ncbi:MAG: S9 family peptidase [Chloroflexota bacterium]
MDSTAFLDALLKLPGLSVREVSYDGRWVAWTWFRAAPTAEVFVASTDGSAAPTRMTNTPENTFFVGWTHDSRSLLVMQDKDGNERNQVFRVDLDRPEVMVPLTEENPNYFLRGVNVTPDGETLVYGANVDLSTGEEIEQTWIYKHHLPTGERSVIARPAKPGYIMPQLNHSGSHVLYTRKDRHPSGVQVWLVDIDGQNDREILNFGDNVKAFARWFPDGRRVLVLGETATHRRLGVWSMDRPEVHWLIDDTFRSIESAFVPFGSDHIVAYEISGARLKSILVNPSTGEEQPLPDVPGELALVAPVGDSDWIGVHSSSRQPGDIVRFPLESVSPTSFTSLSQVWKCTDLTPDDLAQAENFTWRSSDDMQIQGWLYRAGDDARGTIVYVHGGPTSHSRDAINNQIQYFVRCGFHVLDPNYRGSTGFGLAFREAIKVHGWGAMEQEDIRTGIQALIDAGIAQPGKIGITGTSYGGYSSWHAITHFDTATLAASAPVCGMTDLVIDYQTTRPDLRPYSEEMLGGSPDEVPDRYFERSPINFVQNIKGRLLIVQGMQDPNVTPENVRTVTERLQANGIEYELAAFDDEGHGISKPANQRRLYPQLATFFESAFDQRTD